MDLPEATPVSITRRRGSLGSHLIRELLKTQPQGTNHSASRNPDNDPDQQKDVRYLSCDILNKSRITALFNKLSVNVESTENLLHKAAACHTTHSFVLTASDSGLFSNQEPMSEEEAVLYTSHNYSILYGMTKGISEGLVIKANRLGLPTVALRILGLYGDCDYKDVLPSLFTAIKNGQHKTQAGEEQPVFEVLDVHKAAEAHVFAAKALLAQDAKLPSAKAVAGKAFFISDGITMPYWDFFCKCCAVAGALMEPIEIKKIPLSVAQVVASVSEWDT